MIPLLPVIIWLIVLALILAIIIPSLIAIEKTSEPLAVPQETVKSRLESPPKFRKPRLGRLRSFKLMGAETLSPNTFFVRGDLEIPSRSKFEGNLIVDGYLRVKDHCALAGDFRANKGIFLADHCYVNGNLVSEGDVYLGELSVVTGVVYGKSVELGPKSKVKAAISPLKVRLGIGSQTLEVRAPRVEHVGLTFSTGVKELDDLLGGELPLGFHVLLQGPPTFDRDVFYLEFLKWCVRNKIPIVVVWSTPTKELFRVLSDAGIDIDSLASERMFSIVDYYTGKVERTGRVIEKRGFSYVVSPDPSSIALGIVTALSELAESPRKALIADILSPMLMDFSPDTVYKFVESILPKLDEQNAISFFTLDSGVHDERAVLLLHRLFSAVLDIRLEQVGKKITKSIGVLKVEGRPVETRYVSYKFEKGKIKFEK